jgi:hypothetical protein
MDELRRLHGEAAAPLGLSGSMARALEVPYPGNG